MTNHPGLLPPKRILDAIVLIRGHKVMLDAALAALYGVETRILVQAVKRNRLMFQLSREEYQDLRSQIVISNPRGGRRTSPYAFTEQGVAMLSSVLHSPRAVSVNIEIMRTFVRLREIVSQHADLGRRLDDLERRYDMRFKSVFDAIRALASQETRPRKRIGFQPQSRT